MSAAARPVLVTRCLGCQRRIHARDGASFARQKLRHMRSCAALKLHGAVPALDVLPPRAVAELTRAFPRVPLRARLAALWEAVAPRLALELAFFALGCLAIYALLRLALVVFR